MGFDSARHLVDLDHLGSEEVAALIEDAVVLSRGATCCTLEGRGVAMLFFEASTRTRLSFEGAGRRCGAVVTRFDSGASSVVKGETLAETVRTVEAIGAEYIVIRHSESGSARWAAEAASGASVINGGDGRRRHPTQALLDAATICSVLGSVAGKRIAIVGDTVHSRVARSNALLLTRLGASVVFVGPRTLTPGSSGVLGVDVCHDLREGLCGADVVYTLRLQLERQRGGHVASLGEYRKGYGITGRTLGWAAPDAVVMHPGPVNPDIELSSELLHDERCLVHKQVGMGVFARMAVLRMLERSRRDG